MSKKLSLFSLGHLKPITLFDHGGIHISLHFARDSPLPHRDVAVVVISTVNTSALHVRDYVFQAAVPKVTIGKPNSLLKKNIRYQYELYIMKPLIYVMLYTYLCFLYNMLSHIMQN